MQGICYNADTCGVSWIRFLIKIQTLKICFNRLKKGVLMLFRAVIILSVVTAVASSEAAVDPGLIERIRNDFNEPNSDTCLTMVNRQKRVSAADIEKVRAAVKLGISYDVKLEGDAEALKENPVDFAVNHRTGSSTNIIAFVVLVDLPADKQPLMLSALKERWAIVNLGAMGKVTGEAAVVRAGQLVYRAFATLMGAGYSGDPRSLMAYIKDVEDLTKLPTNLEPEALSRMERFAKEVGLNRISVYRGYRLRMAAGEVPPLNPLRWKMWEERTGRKVEQAYKELGYDAGEVKSAYAEWLKTVPEDKREEKLHIEKPERAKVPKK